MLTLRSRHRLLITVALVSVGTVTLGPAALAAAPDSRLIGYAALPAETFAEGPPSGSAITAANGVTPPFASQPVQGFSAVHDRNDGTFDVMPDNGYGAKGNSADFYLRMYRIRPSFETGTVPLPAPLQSGSGGIEVMSFISFRDPNSLVPFTIINGATPQRLLTGADFDIESMQQAPDGTLWIGDEFGPYLLHFDATGVLLDAPISLPDFSTPDPYDVIQSPQNPNLVGTPRAVQSGGFEGMAISPDGATLYPLLERPLGNVGTTLLIHPFDVATKQYVGTQMQYPLTDGTNIGDFILSDASNGMVIERDNTQGNTAGVKRIFKVTLPAGGSGAVTKSLLVNLNAISDPDGISLPGQPGDVGLGTTFSFPFVTIEDVVLINPTTIGVLNDNNFPFSKGRHLGTGAPDDNEFIILSLDTAPPIEVPEAPIAVLLPLTAALLGGGLLFRIRRTARLGAA